MTVFLVVLTLFTINFFVFLYVLYHETFRYSKRQAKKHKPASYGQYLEYKDKIGEIYNNLTSAPFEQVYIKNRKKMTLAARFYEGKENAPLVIMFHGYKSRAMYDSGGAYRIFSEKGYNILIVDQRAHGLSDGRALAFGVTERFDCLDWIDYGIERFGEDTEIILLGVSMGAATVLMASGLKLPKNVKGVIADCPYSSPKAIITKVINEMKYLPLKQYIFPFVRLSGILYGGFDVEAMTTTEAAKNSTVPILIIHGDGDGFVPCEMTLEIAKAAEIKPFIVSGADHGLSYVVATDEYTKEVDRFLEEECRLA